MFLKSLYLQNFRSYKKSSFEFSKKTTFIIGLNTSGKTNLIESIYILSTGKSFRTDKDTELINLGEDFAKVKGCLEEEEENEKQLEVLITSGKVIGRESPLKKYLVNGISKRRIDFADNFKTVLFSPVDLDIIISSPSKRRNFFDEVLEQTDREYRRGVVDYVKAIRQRNALLEKVQETGVRNEKQFEYWENLLIENGELITKKREELTNYINMEDKEIFNFKMIYDKSTISKERLLQYKDAEVGAGVTLVGPHRDDFYILMKKNEQELDVKTFASRGQQRLVVLQLKLLQLSFIKKTLGINPLLLLDDIFSELDEKHINLILKMVNCGQSIITTTHKEFIDRKFLNNASVIELELRR